MTGSLIIYSSTDGHTKTICQRIMSCIADGNSKNILSLKEAAKINLLEFDKIIIGASIRYGRHSRELYKFIKLNKSILDQRNSVFFFSKCCC